MLEAVRAVAAPRASASPSPSAVEARSSERRRACSRSAPGGRAGSVNASQRRPRRDAPWPRAPIAPTTVRPATSPACERRAPAAARHEPGQRRPAPPRAGSPSSSPRARARRCRRAAGPRTSRQSAPGSAPTGARSKCVRIIAPHERAACRGRGQQAAPRSPPVRAASAPQSSTTAAASSSVQAGEGEPVGLLARAQRGPAARWRARPAAGTRRTTSRYGSCPSRTGAANVAVHVQVVDAVVAMHGGTTRGSPPSRPAAGPPRASASSRLTRAPPRAPGRAARARALGSSARS